jgi:hypothetical protein
MYPARLRKKFCATAIKVARSSINEYAIQGELLKEIVN